jgi:hypothetical protein
MRVLFSSLAVVVLALFLTLPVAAEPPGTLEGRIVNGTKGGGPVPGLEVTLRPSSPEAGPDQRTAADKDGKFRFGGLSATTPFSYTLSTSYTGVEYKSQGVILASGEELKQVELPVYEVTEDSSAIKSDLAHIVIEVDPKAQTLVVMEYQVLSNGGDKTYLGLVSSGSGKRETLRFPLPQDAVHLQPIDGLDANEVVTLSKGPGFADSVPLQPGKREVAYSYMLDYNDRSYTFQRALAYPVGRINLLVADVGAQVNAPGLASQQMLDIEGKKFLLLSGEGLGQGQSIEVQLSGLPLGQGNDKGVADNLKLAAIGLPLAALALALVFFLTKGRRPQMRLAPAAIPADDEKARLLQALAELDDSYEAGRMPEAEYQRLRSERKQRLAELW